VLAIKERTAYELAGEMRHCFEYFWPRADARVYAEAKRLSAAGLVSTSEERVGRRRRTSYAITSPGRAELRRWLATLPKPVALEFEALVKVYLARLGTRDDLLRALEATAADATYMLQVAANVRQVYLEGCAPFQDEYLHTWAFVYDFLTDYFAMLHRWAARTASQVQAWPDLDPDGKRADALELFRRKRPGGAARPVSDPAAMPGTWQEGRSRPRHATG
jgi:DNA-binding PadR family transcriptional regulator